MKALAMAGCIFCAAGFLLAAHSAVSPSRAARPQPVIEPGRVLEIREADEVEPPKARADGCCKPEQEAPQKAHGCSMGCE
jgi:hypothetical protein